MSLVLCLFIDVIYILPCSLLHHEDFMNLINFGFDHNDLITIHFSRFHHVHICILDIVARHQVLNQSHSFFWSHGLEVSFGCTIHHHFIMKFNTPEKDSQQLNLNETMMWIVPLIFYSFSRFLSECPNFIPQLFRPHIIKESSQKCSLDIILGSERSWL